MLNCDRSTVKHALRNTQSDCYQWLSNNSRGHLAGLKGLLLRAWEGKGRERREAKEGKR